ncbi:MAG: 50S ribosomal protein L15 [Proteobacteria bacterium]|nr:50S ribosomal protein L15 [Pseudomonadota bacterium]
MKLNEIRDNLGARTDRMRVGRGEGSGKGKTCGSGQKGQKSRTGVALKGFEGGQNPLYRRLPKRGFSNVMFATNFTVINLGQLQAAIEAKKIDASKTINHDVLVGAGLIKGTAPALKLLAKGELKQAVNIEVAKASKTACDMVEKLKGSVTIA